MYPLAILHVLKTEAARIARVTKGKKADYRMRLVLGIDRTARDWNLAQWAAFLQVQPSTISLTSWWKEHRSRKARARATP